MGKFDGVLLVSDFDDTLYSGQNKVAPPNLEALDYFISQGGRFTVATGGPTAPSPPMPIWSP